jgi:hypothetical protein
MEVEEDELGMCWIGFKVLSFMLVTTDKEQSLDDAG